MKKSTRFIAGLLIFIALSGVFTSCLLDKECGTYNGKTLYKEGSGDCYYEDDDCNKVYVADSNCDC